MIWQHKFPYSKQDKNLYQLNFIPSYNTRDVPFWPAFTLQPLLIPPYLFFLCPFPPPSCPHYLLMTFLAPLAQCPDCGSRRETFSGKPLSENTVTFARYTLHSILKYFVRDNCSYTFSSFVLDQVFLDMVLYSVFTLCTTFKPVPFTLIIIKP